MSTEKPEPAPSLETMFYIRADTGSTGTSPEEVVKWMNDAAAHGIGATFVKAGRPLITPEQATAEKGYPHPGSFIALPDGGGTIHLQYGHPSEVGRNGCFTADVIQGLIENLSVYEQSGHDMADPSTSLAILALDSALRHITFRKRDRKARGVHETDKP